MIREGKIGIVESASTWLANNRDASIGESVEANKREGMNKVFSQ